jgi:hypothetical protein
MCRDAFAPNSPKQEPVMRKRKMNACGGETFCSSVVTRIKRNTSRVQLLNLVSAWRLFDVEKIYNVFYRK